MAKHKDIQQKIMGALKPAFVSDIKKKIKSGELESPISLKEMVSSVDDSIKLNPWTWAATSMLGIRPEDYRGMLKEALIECGLEVIE